MFRQRSSNYAGLGSGQCCYVVKVTHLFKKIAKWYSHLSSLFNLKLFKRSAYISVSPFVKLPQNPYRLKPRINTVIEVVFIVTGKIVNS